MCNSIEWGRCEICGKETQLERTYFYYPIHCECCGNKENRDVLERIKEKGD